MPIVRGENKIAVLLTSLPREAAEAVLVRLGAERSHRLRGLMDRARADLTPELVDQTLREFEEALFQATRGAPAQRLRLAPDTAHEADTYVSGDRSISDIGSHENGESSTGPKRIGSSPVHEAPPVDDAVAELRLLDSERIAAALQGEHPRGVATVLSCLDAGKASETLMRLSPEVRKEVFTRLGQATGGAGDVALRIVRAVVEKSRAFAADPAQSGGDDKAQMMADMLKSLERGDRSDLMSALAERDEALAVAVRDRLYVFDDLSAIDGRSMQRLLAEIDSKTLAVSLQGAQENVVENVMNNLSKRARESLSEEMNFLGSIAAAQVQQARKVVVEAIQRMDQAEEAG